MTRDRETSGTKVGEKEPDERLDGTANDAVRARAEANADPLCADDVAALKEALVALAMEDFYATLQNQSDGAEGDATELTLGKLPATPTIKVCIYMNEAAHKEPHFHIQIKKDSVAAVAIRDQRVLVGELPSRYRKKIMTWASEHAGPLMKAWELVQAGQIVTDFEM